MIISDFIFQKRMIFGPIYLFVSLSILFHATLLIVDACTDLILKTEAKEWIMLVEGLLDMMVQFYMYFMAPMQIARIHRLT